MIILWILILFVLVYMIFSQKSFYNIVVPQHGGLYNSNEIGQLPEPIIDRPNINTQLYERI